MPEERMLKWFASTHLPENLRDVAEVFDLLARGVCERLQPGPERTVALRKLLEAKDSAVRAAAHPGS